MELRTEQVVFRGLSVGKGWNRRVEQRVQERHRRLADQLERRSHLRCPLSVLVVAQRETAVESGRVVAMSRPCWCQVVIDTGEMRLKFTTCLGLVIRVHGSRNSNLEHFDP